MRRAIGVTTAEHIVTGLVEEHRLVGHLRVYREDSDGEPLHGMPVAAIAQCLADEIKHVLDHHLLELIRENEAEGHRIPPGRVETPHAAAVAAGAEESRRMFPAGVPAEFSAASLPANPEHQPEQEDYLWGV